MKMAKKTMILASSAAVATVLSLTAVSAVFAADSTQSSLAQQAQITMQQASDIVTNANSGCTIDQIKLKNENGTAAYEIDITNSDSTKSEVDVNADNGTIIQTKAKADKQAKNEQKAAVKSQQQTLNSNWTSMTDEQKEQVYALKDAEFDVQIDKVKSHVASGYKTQEEVDKIVSQIQEQKTAMRESGNAPEFKSIVNFPTASSN